MSASREKRKRAENRAHKALNPSKKNGPGQEKTQSVLTGVITCAIVLTLLFLFLSGSGIFQANLTALTIGGVKISGAEFNYHYHTTVMDSANEYYLYQMFYGMDMPFDPFTSLKSQPYTEDQSWADYFEEEVIDLLTPIVLQSEQAKIEGISLTDADRKAIDRQVSDLQKSADENDITLNKALQQQYGRGVTESSFRKFLERQYLSDRYKSVTMEGYARTGTDIEDYYNEHRENYDYVKYHTLPFSMTPDKEQDEEGNEVEPSEEELEAYKTEQRARAEEMLQRVTTSDMFYELSREYADEDEDEGDDFDPDFDGDDDDDFGDGDDDDDFGDDDDDDDFDSDDDDDFDLDFDDDDDDFDDEEEEDEDDPTLKTTLVFGLSEAYKDYLGAAERKIGDKTLLEDANNYYVVLFESRYRKEGLNVDVRHILVGFPEDDEDEEHDEDEDEEEHEVSAEVKAEAKERAESILAEWKNGDQTAEFFAALAAEKSDDPGSLKTGGLYSNISPATDFVQPFLDWCLAESRKQGDTGIVETEHGFHVMYLDKILLPEWQQSVKDDMNKADYDTLYEEISEDKAAKVKLLGMSFTKQPLKV